MRIGYKLATEGFPPKRHLDVARQYADAGFDHLVAMNAGPDPDGFLEFFASELAGPLRALTPRLPAPPRQPQSHPRLLTRSTRPAMRPVRAQLRRHPAFGSACRWP